MWSLPSRERGLKHQIMSYGVPDNFVAPFAGAWIETPYSPDNIYSIFVAPFAGAWIETLQCQTARFPHAVAPFAGAWIETFLRLWDRAVGESLPSRERGLKLWYLFQENTTFSRSLRGSVD